MISNSMSGSEGKIERNNDNKILEGLSGGTGSETMSPVHLIKNNESPHLLSDSLWSRVVAQSSKTENKLKGIAHD